SALVRTVAARLARHLAGAQDDGRTIHLGLTGGTVATEIYAEVARLCDTGANQPNADRPSADQPKVDWRRVALWWGDERFVAADSPDRNAVQARRAFIDACGVPDHHVHEVPSATDVSSAAEAAERYAVLLGAEGAAQFDLLLLGVGPDGHVASLFPGFPQLDRDDALAVGVADSPKPPPERVTLTLRALNSAREVWFLVSGADKAWAVSQALSPADPSQKHADPSEMHVEAAQMHAETLPASLVRGRLRTRWFLDQAAASDIA
ncbi:MAG: 6-phosphogluconolactonase, partial [Nocardioides sp.]